MSDKKIGLVTACALVIANMIGTGVFSSLGFQVGSLPSIPILLFLWLCGGLIALFGGLSYIELAKLHPGSGGEYHYISQAYPKLLGYFAGLVSVIAGFAAPVALAAITFSRYFVQFAPQVSQKWLSFALISFVTFFHCFSIKLGSRFQLLSTSIKIILVLIFIVYGLSVPGFANPIELDKSQLMLISSKGFAVSLIYVAFAYSGWNACIYIFSEIRNPLKNIRLSIIIGTMLVTLLYVLLNFVFLKTVPMASLKGVIEIGAISADAIFGNIGGKWIAILISLLLVSSISAMVWVGSRVIERMMNGKKVDQKEQETARTPLKAICLQYSVTTLLLFTETFQRILVAAGVLLVICSCLSVAILFFPKNNIPKIKLVAPAIFLLINFITMIVLLTD